MNFKRQSLLAIVLGMVLMVLPSTVQASQLTPRSLALGSSTPFAVTTHMFTFTIPTGGNVGSILFQYCTSATGACTMPSGLDTTAATLAIQSGATGFGINTSTNGSPYITRGASSVSAGTSVSYTLGNVMNPSPVNTTFWVRITTYSGAGLGGSAVDDGVVAASTGAGIVISGYMPETLVFCVGTSGTDCTNMTGTTVNFGIFSPLSTSTSSSVMSASTNAGSGYNITVAGTTLTSGINTIPSLGTQSLNSSNAVGVSTGVAQFGMNLRQNTTPSVGSDISGLGSGTPIGGYNSVNSFRYFSGDTIATAAGPTKANLYTSSYVVNVSPDQAAGTYSTTLTYICTGLF